MDGFSYRDLLTEEKEGKDLIAFPQIGPFIYEKRSHGVFVFTTEDRHYSLKIVDQKRYSAFSLKKKSKKRVQKAIEKMPALLAKEEYGIVLDNIESAHRFLEPVEIQDPSFVTHRVDLNQVEFVLQKRGEDLQSYLKGKKKEEIEKAYLQIKELLIATLDKGCYNKEKKVALYVEWSESTPYLEKIESAGRDSRLKNREFSTSYLDLQLSCLQ